MSDPSSSGGLAAYTESAQRSAAATASSSKGKGKGKSKGGKGGSGDGRDRSSSSSRPSKSKRLPSSSSYKKGSFSKTKLDFDEQARLEYLTGFHKRKLQRIELAQKKREEEAKEERKRNRREAQEARKERAAENVAAERRAYGGDEDQEEDDDDGESEREEIEVNANASYDAPEHHTTVVVSEWDPNAAEEEQESHQYPSSSSSKVSNTKNTIRNGKTRVASYTMESLPPSSKRMEKKIKSSSKGIGNTGLLSGPSSSRRKSSSKTKPPVPSASSISSLLLDPLASHDSLTHPESTPNLSTLSVSEVNQGLTHLSSASERKAIQDAIVASKPFRYEGKLERTKKKLEIRARNEKFKMERIEKLKRGGGGSGGAGTKGKGKGKGVKKGKK